MLEIIGVRLVLDDFGVHEYNSKNVQNTVYLAKASGVNLGYAFAWYGKKKGVFSPELSEDYYKISSVKNYSEYYFNNELKEKINNCVKATERPNSFIKMDMWLDFVASIVFLANDGKNYDEIAEKLVIDMNFPLDYYERTYKKLGKCGLV